MSFLLQGGQLSASTNDDCELMPRITFKSYSGQERTIDAEVGLSVMDAAVKHAVSGIDADCGGACACATCHVYVAPAWLDRVGPKGPTEAEMLDFAQGAQDNSRLACQIKITPDLDGLEVTTPLSQH